MGKVFFSTVLFLVFCGNIFSQNEGMDMTEPSGFSIQKITYGGNLGGSFTKNYSSVTIAPQIGYNFTNCFNVGLGVKYSYLGYKDDDYSEKDHYAGINIYGRAAVLQYLLIQLQPELNHVWWETAYKGYAGEKVSGKGFVPSFIIGAGFLHQNLYAMLYYDVMQNNRSPYGNSIGYSIGFLF